MNKRRGFTIVEIAVVIVIISTLVALTVTVFNRVQTDARDNVRQGQITALKASLVRYYNFNGEYPLPSGCTAGNACSVTSLASVLVPQYISEIPTQPGTTGYQYIRDSTGTSYALYVNRESDVACKTGTSMTTTWFSSAATCPY